MNALYCNNCGHRNPEGSNFCSSCGAVLERPGEASSFTTTITLASIEPTGESGDEEVTVSVGEAAEGAGVLVVKRGANAGSRFVLGPGITSLGRHPDSDIFLDDVTVSRRHAEVIAEAGGFRVRDVGSLNGTYLNRERIEEARLANGDELQVGKFRLVFLAEAADG